MRGPLRIDYQPWGQTLAELVDAGQRAEEAGARTLWVPELHRSATGVAAALAAGTQRARVGTGVLLAFTRSPLVTALESLDLDEMSGGRFVLGLGAGVQRLNEDWHNVVYGKPVAHMRETIDAIRTFWRLCDRGEPIVVEGDWQPMSIRGYQRPFPVDDPDIPVYLAAMGPLMTRLAGRTAQGWIGHELCSPSYLRERVLPELEIGLSRGGRGRDQLDVVVSACCSIADNVVVARRRATSAAGFYATVRTYADFFAFHDLAEDQQAVISSFRAGQGAAHLAEVVSDRMADTLTMVGSRDDVAARIAAYEGLADAVKLSPPVHGLAPADVRAAQGEILTVIAELTGALR